MHSDNPESLELFYRVMPDNYLLNLNIALKIRIFQNFRRNTLKAIHHEENEGHKEKI